MIYRVATSADVPAMEECRVGDVDAGAPDSRMAAYLDGRHHPGQAKQPRTGVVALDDDRVVGYIAGHLTRRFRCEGELQYLYVAPSHRRSGVARALVQKLADWFVSQGAKKICVNAADDAAAAFYRRIGANDLTPHWLMWDDIQSVR
jgi:GNAT superfamily N-acetyltransferase